MSLILPNSDQLSHIREVLKEDVTTSEYDLVAIKDWLRKQPHLPDTFDDRRLMNFLRGCKFSLEKCKKKLDMYFTMRGHVTEFFTNRDVSRPEMQELLSYAFVINLPTLTSDGKRVHVTGVTTTDFRTPDVADFFKLVFMVRDIRLERESLGTVGDVYVLDASVLIPRHFLKISFAAIKKFLICNLEAYPTMLKEVHVVNATSLLDRMLGMVKPMLKEKIRRRIHVHTSMDTLHQFVPKELLPEEYGGTAGKLDEFRAKSIETLKEYTEWFKEQEQVVSDESKRLGKSYCYEELFGLDGSFRQLNID